MALFLLLSCINSYGQSGNEELIAQIKKDSEWNLPNYFDKIDQAVKKPGAKNEKAMLYFLKAKYYGIIDQHEKGLKILNQAQKWIESNKAGDSIRAMIHMRKCSYYGSLNNFSKAYREWVISNNYYVLHKNYDGMSYSQQILAAFYTNLNQFKSAKKAFARAKKYAMVNKNDRVLNDLYVGLSSYWGIREKYNLSLYYLKLSERHRPFNSIDFNEDYNKGILYFKKGDMKKARFYIQQSIDKAEKVKCLGFAGMGRYALAISYMEEDHDRAFQLMKEALDMIDKNNPDVGINICECILSNFDGKEYQSLLPFFEKRKQQFKKERERIDKIQVGELFEMSSVANEELLRTQSALERKNDEENKQQLLLTVLSISGLGLLIILTLLFSSYRSRLRDQHKLNSAYEEQKNILTHSIVAITNHNAIAENLIKRLKKLALEQTSKKLSDELYELSRHISDNTVGVKSRELKDLDLMIQSINDGFVKRLCSRFENLSHNEVTLAIYLRMNFTTKQIAELKGTSENSIDVARSRLRTKLGIKGENVDLITFLNGI